MLVTFILLFCFGLRNSLVGGSMVPTISNQDENVERRKLECVVGRECRLMFAYEDARGCAVPEDWDDYKMKENAEEQNRLRILSEYEKRVNEAIQNKPRKTLYDPRLMRREFPSLNQIENSQRSRSENYEENEIYTNEVSIKIKTRQLKSLSMEVVVIPEGLSTDEALNLSKDLPCLELASPDYNIIIPQNEKSVILTELPSTLYQEEFGDEQPSSPNIRGSIDDDEIVNNRTTTEAPNDPLFILQWYLKSNEPYGVKSERVWDIPGVLPEMVVAVIDSGCDLTHPDLATQFWKNPNETCGDGIDNDGNGYIDDCYGWNFVDNNNWPQSPTSTHGTSVSGIIAASSNNGKGISGICRNCKLMCLRFISESQGRITDQVAALDYAVSLGVKISNNSYGGYGKAEVELKAIARLQKANHLFVSSSGNESRDTDLPEYLHSPSAYPLDNILSVGASTRYGRKASYSNYGKTTVDLLAPGSTIVSTNYGGTYSLVSGTSFSAPVASSCAAIIWSAYPMLPYQDVIDSMVTTCTKTRFDTPKWTQCGGILDLPKALERAALLAKRQSTPLTA